jgi:hypothetical protein
MKGDHPRAQYWYELALDLDPAQSRAWQNLVEIHARAGRPDLAEHCRTKAYALQRIFVEEADRPARRVLLLCSGRAAGNVPFDLLVPPTKNTRIKYAIDYAAEAEDARLPDADLAFNAIGEPDVAEPITTRLRAFARRYAKPLLNAPDRVAATRRDRLPASIEGIAGLGFPLLARPASSHGGVGLTRCASADELDAALSRLHGPCYLSTYRDHRGADGHYRKYRVMYVDRVPYPYHLAISPHWMVHYYSAEMIEHAWKLEEEMRFLVDPLAALGARAWAALAELGRRFDLDYAGVDFTIMPDRGIFVFEANATMLAHRERPDGPLARKNFYVQHIADAFDDMLESRSSSR